MRRFYSYSLFLLYAVNLQSSAYDICMPINIHSHKHTHTSERGRESMEREGVLQAINQEVDGRTGTNYGLIV